MVWRRKQKKNKKKNPMQQMGGGASWEFPVDPFRKAPPAHPAQKTSRPRQAGAGSPPPGDPRGYAAPQAGPRFIEIEEYPSRGAPPTPPPPPSEEIDPEQYIRAGTLDPTKIVRALIHRLKCQDVSAAEFCRFVGLHKNTLTRWKTGKQECPMSYAILFKWLVMDMDDGASFRQKMMRLYQYVV